ncbi:MAG: hypothetical protein H0X27_05575 [Caulobacteraceae bacterium]|nr:hypothetical protein [Caulobacteraceae bacterium]
MTSIAWATAVDGAFDDTAGWSGGVAPGAGDRAILGFVGTTHYTVTAAMDTTIGSLRMAATATLAITGGVFTINGSVSNSGLITVGASGAELRFSGATMLTGGGQIALADSKTSYINTLNQAAAELTNVDETISGAGQLAGRGFFLTNQAGGLVDATGDHALIVKGTADSTNAGLMEGTGKAGLTLKKTTMDNGASGVLSAGDGSKVRLRGAVIAGGTLESTGTGKFVVRGVVNGAGENVLDGGVSTVTNQAIVSVIKGAALTLRGAIDNGGQIRLARPGGASDLFIGDGGATLSGAGQITLSHADRILGASAGATLTNAGNTIAGAGQLGAGQMTLVNQAGGVIDANAALALVIDTGAAVITNAGTIEASGVGDGRVMSAVDNTGTLMVAGGRLAFVGAVTGAGSAVIGEGTLEFDSSFTEDVAFTGASGVLQLGQSQGYAGKISGFSGGMSLDLRDIGFTDAGEATFAGDATSGVLTVTDGTHTAHITLTGDYTGASFVASSDGHGGVSIADTSAAVVAAPLHALVAAMAAMPAASAATAPVANDAHAPSWRPMLAVAGHAHFA